MPTTVKPLPDVNQTRAVRDLLAAGWSADEITGTLRISRRTYFRRLSEIRGAEAALRGSRRPAPAACR